MYRNRVSSNRARWLLVGGAYALIASLDSVRTQPATTAGMTRLEIVSGSKAEYRVREQLARLNFPNDAVGTTESITGRLDIRSDGSFASDSKLTVDLRTLKTDDARRDAFLRENTLHTDRFPLTEFVPRRHKGLPTPLPPSGTARFHLIGDMTLHGTTVEQSWDVEAVFATELVTAKATTRFAFGRFGLNQPKVMGLISVQDDIRLELNIRARRIGR
jgi:polyisoprenoid-binding protein YceI